MLMSSELLIMGVDEDVQISTHTSSKKQKCYQMMTGYADVRDAAFAVRDITSSTKVLG